MSLSKKSFVYVEETPGISELECHICLDPLTDPVVHSDCQVMFCKECIAPYQKCPTCDKPLDQSKLAPVPKFILNLLESFKVKCPSCNEGIERRLITDHISKCAVLCELCGQKIRPIDKQNHDQNDCGGVAIHCPAKDKYCSWNGLRKDLAEHSKTCQFALMAPVIQILVDQFQGLLKQQRDQFLQQIQQQKAEITQLREDMILNMNVSAAKKKWKLTMSSKFFSVANTYESLVDDDHCLTGAATDNKQGKEWIQASFEFPVLVSSITVSGFKGAMIAWRSDYCEGKQLQYSHDDATWHNSLTIDKVNQGKATKIQLESPVIARYWRLFGNGYCATATFILE